MAMVVPLGARCSLRPLQVHNPTAVPFASLSNLSFGYLRPPSRPQRLWTCIAVAAADDATPSSNPAPDEKVAVETPPPPKPKATTAAKKPIFSMSKGQIVRVDKEKYLNSVEYLAVGHPKYYRGLDYIYEDRGEILDIRNYSAGEYALVTWAGISTSPAWLPTYMLIKSDKLSYRRT